MSNYSSFDRIFGRIFERREGLDWRKPKVDKHGQCACAFCTGKLNRDNWVKSSGDEYHRKWQDSVK